MSNIKIAKIEADSSGHISVTPDIPLDKDYSFIYRDASFVRWNVDTRSLYVAPDAELVDVTMQLVQAYNPKPGTQDAMESLLKMKPMDYEEIVNHEIEGGH